jgi:hypothetical protein
MEAPGLCKDGNDRGKIENRGTDALSEATIPLSKFLCQSAFALKKNRLIMKSRDIPTPIQGGTQMAERAAFNQVVDSRDHSAIVELA